ncbi:unnamed protein product [Lathyrus sativus]|nr:unnamed protein product [Lathyrus sativus]
MRPNCWHYCCQVERHHEKDTLMCKGLTFTYSQSQQVKVFLNQKQDGLNCLIADIEKLSALAQHVSCSNN